MACLLHCAATLRQPLSMNVSLMSCSFPLSLLRRSVLSRTPRRNNSRHITAHFPYKKNAHTDSHVRQPGHGAHAEFSRRAKITTRTFFTGRHHWHLSSKPEHKQLPPPPTSDSKVLPSPGPLNEDPIPIASAVPTLPLWQRLGPLTWAADSYGRAQRRRPYITQLCSALVSFFCADLSVQYMNRHCADYDPERAMRALIIGGISAIPSYKWFVFLAYNFNYTSRLLSLATKVIVNQICYTPVFNSYFFGMQALLAGETITEAWSRICRTVPISFLNSFKVWPAATAFSFAFIPLEYRGLFQGVIAVGWQTYLVYLNRRAEDAEALDRTGN